MDCINYMTVWGEKVAVSWLLCLDSSGRSYVELGDMNNTLAHHVSCSKAQSANSRVPAAIQHPPRRMLNETSEHGLYSILQ